MTVYILFEIAYCEPKFFRGVFSTPELAEAAKERLEQQFREVNLFGVDLVIEPTEVDQ